MSLRRTVFAFAARQVSPSAMARHFAVGVFLVAFMAFFARFLCSQVLPIDPSCTPDRWRWDSTCDPAIWTVSGLTDLFAIAALAIGLFLIVPAMISAQLGQERRSGTLEQLRSSPASSYALIGGFILGAPVRVYLMLAAPLLYHIAYGALGGLSIAALVGSVFVLALGSVVLSMVAVVAALGPRRSDVSSMQPLSLAAIIGCLGLTALGMSCALELQLTGLSLLHPLGALASTLFVDDNVFRHVFAASNGFTRGGEPSVQASLATAPIFFAVIMVPIVAILGGAALRRLRDPELPLFSKPLGIALFVVLLGAYLAPFAFPTIGTGEGLVYFCGFGSALLPVVLVLAQLMTPSAERWAIGLHQPSSLFSDARGPFAAVFVMTLLFVTANALSFGLTGPSFLSVSAMWGLYLALTAPIFFLYRATTHAGGLFLFGYAAWMLLQLIGMGTFDATTRGHNPIAQVVCITSVALGVCVPAWLQFRQMQLRSTLRAA